MSGSNIDSVNPNSNPHACASSTFFTEPSAWGTPLFKQAFWELELWSSGCKVSTAQTKLSPQADLPPLHWMPSGICHSDRKLRMTKAWALGSTLPKVFRASLHVFSLSCLVPSSQRPMPRPSFKSSSPMSLCRCTPTLSPPLSALD